MSNQVFSTAIVGLGNIGQGYDISLSPKDYALSHARAFDLHPGYELAAGADIDLSARERFESAYKVVVYDSINALLENESPEVVVIAVPAEAHSSVMESVLSCSRKPKAILCEKPFGVSKSDALAMQEMALQSDVVLSINYMRRFEPGIRAIKEQILANKFGALRHGIVWYPGSFLTNASHFLNQLEFLFGKIESFQMFPTIESNIPDVAPTAELRVNGCPILLASSQARDYSPAEIELFFEKASLRFAAGGRRIEKRAVVADELYSGHRILSDEMETEESSDFARVQSYVVDNLYKAMLGEADLLCASQDAVDTWEILENLLLKPSRRNG